MAFLDEKKQYPKPWDGQPSFEAVVERDIEENRRLGMAEGERVVVVFEKGAVDDIEKLRAAIMQTAPIIEINAGFRFEIHRGTPRHLIMQRGAVDDLDIARAEMKKPIGLVAINPGFEVKLLDANLKRLVA